MIFKLIMLGYGVITGLVGLFFTWLIEEADSVFDSCGNEHPLDEDGYCEECDDYHDWD